MADAGVDFPLVHASAENVPLPDESFDVVFCNHGAIGWADPYRTVPEPEEVEWARCWPSETIWKVRKQ